MRQLTALDALFLAAENDRTQGHVSAMGVYDPVTASGRPLDAALVRELVTERMHLLPPLRWRLAGVPFGLDHPYWVDEGIFDVDYHVRDVALPSPGDQRQLAEQVAQLIASHLDRARPLWEMYVIHGLHDGAVAVLTKMHHAAVDGVSGAEVMGVAARRHRRPVGSWGRHSTYLLSASRPAWRCWAAVWSGCCVSLFGRCAPCRPRCLTSMTYRRSATCPG